MNSLIDLANKIAQYNLIGQRKLLLIKLAVLHTPQHSSIVQQLIKEMQCQSINSLAQVFGISGYQCFISEVVQHLQIFLIDHLYSQEAVHDEQFLKRRKIIQTLRANPEVYFLYLNPQEVIKSIIDEREQLMDLKRVDTTVSRDIVWKGNTAILYRDISKTWQSMNRYNLINSLQDTKKIVKGLLKDEKREKMWIEMIKSQVDPLSYAFQLNYISKSYLISSFQGYYSPETIHFPNKYSIHWQIMDILEDLWKEQGAQLKQGLQKMPLSYIEEQLKMGQFNQIGGFLPESCFLRIFKPLLQRLTDATIICLEGAKYKIIHNIQTVYEYYYSKTTIKQSLIQLQVSQIQKICDNFLRETINAIQSQISYVYAPAQSFWQMRNIKSGLYSAEQQTNIEIKYIGKIYVQKVYQAIRESVPRYIGQGLLRKISKYISDNSMQNLLHVMNEVPLAITLTRTEQQQILSKQAKKLQCQRLANYFSLKVNSTYLLKNINKRIQRQWRDMFKQGGEEEDKVRESEREVRKQKGFLNWMKRVFSVGDQEDNPKRSKSIERKQQQPRKRQEQISLKANQPVITDKAWILILHNNKKVDDNKIMLSSCQGFSERLRPSIWYWLSTKDSQNSSNSKKYSHLFTTKANPDTDLQIQKDLSRTPPPQLFRKKYRSSLKKVLIAYSLVDQEVSYTQGMNFLAATIICTLIHYGIKDDYLIESSENRNIDDLEEKSFVIFRCMMEKKGFRRMMLVERAYIAELCYKIHQQIKTLNERVSNMIEETGFTCEVIFGPLLISGLMGWTSSTEIKQRVVDLILCQGYEVCYLVIAGIVAMSENQLSNLKNEMVYDFLKNKALDVFFEKYGHKGLTQLFLTF